MKSESHDGKNERDGNVINFEKVKYIAFNEDIKNVLFHPDRVNEHYKFERGNLATSR